MPNNLKGYDANQVLRSVFDVDENCLRVCVVEGTTGGGAFEVIISHTDDSIRLGDGSQLVTTTLVLGKVGLDVNVLNEVNIEDLDASKDSVAVKDSDGDELEVNPDGSINVNPYPSTSVAGLQKYNEVTAVASGIETLVVSHTAVGGRKTFLQKVSASGDNVSKYRVKINGVEIDMKRTYFGGSLNANFSFDGELNHGLEVAVGDVISLTAIHNRPDVSDFNGKIQYLEVI